MYKGLLLDWANVPVRGVALKTLKGTRTHMHEGTHTCMHACMHTHTHTHARHTGLFTITDVQNIISEITTMQEFDHPHVMSLIGVCLDAGPGVSMVMPFMANGSLLDYLKKERSNLVIEEAQDSEDKVCNMLIVLAM